MYTLYYNVHGSQELFLHNCGGVKNGRKSLWEQMVAKRPGAGGGHPFEWGSARGVVREGSGGRLLSEG